jgi:hypothetical protein
MTKAQLNVLMGIQEFVSNEWILKQFGFSIEEMDLFFPEKRAAFIEKCANPDYDITEQDAKILENIFKDS